MTHDTDNHPTPEAAERARFEAWAGEKGYVTTLSVHIRYRTFVSRSTEYAWIGWQARAALAAQEGDDGERVAVSEDKLLFIAMNAYDNTMARGLNEVAAMRMAVRNVLRAAQEGGGNDR